MSEITGGELLVRCLHAEGIAHIHAITDGTYMMVLEAIERLKKVKAFLLEMSMRRCGRSTLLLLLAFEFHITENEV